MARLGMLLLTTSLGLVCGCDRGKDTAAGAPDVMLQKPTVEEVEKQVRPARANRTGRGVESYGPAPYQATVIGGLKPVPDTYFTRQKNDVDPAAVAAYVEIRQWTAPGIKAGDQVTIELVVIGRNSRRYEPKLRGQIDEYQIVFHDYIARDLFGPEWLAEHPWPKEPAGKRKGGR